MRSFRYTNTTRFMSTSTSSSSSSTHIPPLSPNSTTRSKSQKQRLYMLAFAGVSAWSYIWFYNYNSQKLNSSVVKGVVYKVSNDKLIKEKFCGPNAKSCTLLLKSNPILRAPFVSGSVNTIKGNADLEFYITCLENGKVGRVEYQGYKNKVGQWVPNTFYLTIQDSENSGNQEVVDLKNWKWELNFASSE